MTDAYDACPEYDAALLEAGLAPTVDARLDAHLAACARCRAAREVYRKATDALAAAFSAPNDARSLFGPPWRKPGARRSVPTLVRRAAAAAVAVVLLGALGAYFYGSFAPRRWTDAPPEIRIRARSQHAAVRVVHPPGLVRTYRTDGRSLRIATPAGVVYAEDAVLQIDAAAVPSTKDPEMHAKQLSAAVGVVVLAGAAYWFATDDLLLPLRPGEPATLVAAGPGAATRRAAELRAGVVGSTPFVDAAAAAEAGEVVGPRTELAFVDGDDRPLVAAAFVVFRGDAPLRAGKSDPRGVAAVAADGAEAEVVVVPTDRFAFRARVALAEGPTKVRAPEGAEVSGFARIDGAPPPTRAPLALRGDRLAAALAGLPPKVRAALGAPAVEPSHLTVVAAADGAFRFRGLPPDWSGELLALEPYEALEPTADLRGVRLERPTAGLTFALREEPALTGRVVRPGTREPIPGARVRARLLSPSMMASRAETAGPDGRFRVALRQKQLSSVFLTVSDAAGRGGRDSQISTGLDRATDLGDLEHRPLRELPLVVVDRAGAPVAGAVASSAAEAVLSEPTDAAGRTTLSLSEADAKVFVAALGYARATLDVPAAGESPLVATLDPGTLLSVRVVGPDGKPATGARLRGESGSRYGIFEGQSSCDDDDYVGVSKASMLAAMSNDSACTVVWALDADGRVELPGVRAGAPLSFAAIDAAGALLDEAKVELRPGERREVALRVDRAPRVAAGRVVDREGRPVAGASVTLKAGEEFADSVATDAEGRFRFAAVYSESTTLEIARVGFVARRIADWKPTPDEAPETIVLEAGVRFAARVVDADGTPLGDVLVYVRRLRADGSPDSGYETLRATTAATGNAVFADAPPETLLLTAQVGDQRLEARHDPRNGDAALRADVAFGRVVVELERPSTVRSVRVGVRRAGSSTLVCAAWPSFGREGRATVVLPYVPVGAYEAVVVDGDDDGDGKSALVPPQDVVVRARETTKVVFAP